MPAAGLQLGESQAEVVRFDHAGDDKHIDQPADAEQPGGAQPNHTGDGFAAIKAVDAKQAQKKPQQIGDGNGFFVHFTILPEIDLHNRVLRKSERQVVRLEIAVVAMKIVFYQNRKNVSCNSRAKWPGHLSHPAKTTELVATPVVFALLAALLLFSCAPKLYNLIEPEAWPTFRGSQKNSGTTSSHLQPPLELTMVWEVPDKIRSTVVANGSKIYLADWSGTLQAIDSQSWQPLWKVTREGVITGSPAIAFDRIVIGSDNASIFAFSLQNGEPLWQHRTGAMVITSPQIYKNLAILGSHDGTLYALDLRTGKAVWHFDTESIITSTAAIANDRIFVGTGAPALFCLRAKDGQPLWKLPTERTIVSSPLIAENRIFFGDWAGVFRAVDTDSGHVLWAAQSAGKIDASATYANGTVFWIDMAGVVYAADAETGAPRWQLPMQGRAISSPIADPEYLYAARYDHGRIFMLRQSTGEVVWSFGLEGNVYASPVIHKGRLYIGTEKGKFYVFEQGK